MAEEKDLLEELAQEIKRNIDSNKKFLQRVFDEDFESEDDENGEAEVFEEL
ncbi:hypothetical protein [Geotalea sp. SG265]|uniref:hypothetical protein n=1 Tax=Geotalea sp. SG265 TaxID=2922867 RepID=UPI001FAFD1A1|nr:hypothetical protein [Geotalea sp. SG265]